MTDTLLEQYKQEWLDLERLLNQEGGLTNPGLRQRLKEFKIKTGSTAERLNKKNSLRYLDWKRFSEKVSKFIKTLDKNHPIDEVLKKHKEKWKTHLEKEKELDKSTFYKRTKEFQQTAQGLIRRLRSPRDQHYKPGREKFLKEITEVLKPLEIDPSYIPDTILEQYEQEWLDLKTPLGQEESLYDSVLRQKLKKFQYKTQARVTKLGKKNSHYTDWKSFLGEVKEFIKALEQNHPIIFDGALEQRKKDWKSLLEQRETLDKTIFLKRVKDFRQIALRLTKGLKSPRNKHYKPGREKFLKEIIKVLKPLEIDPSYIPDTILEQHKKEWKSLLEQKETLDRSTLLERVEEFRQIALRLSPLYKHHVAGRLEWLEETTTIKNVIKEHLDATPDELSTIIASEQEFLELLKELKDLKEKYSIPPSSDVDLCLTTPTTRYWNKIEKLVHEGVRGVELEEALTQMVREVGLDVDVSTKIQATITKLQRQGKSTDKILEVIKKDLNKASSAQKPHLTHLGGLAPEQTARTFSVHTPEAEPMAEYGNHSNNTGLYSFESRPFDPTQPLDQVDKRYHLDPSRTGMTVQTPGLPLKEQGSSRQGAVVPLSTGTVWLPSNPELYVADQHYYEVKQPDRTNDIASIPAEFTPLTSDEPAQKPFYQQDYVQKAVVSCTVFADAMVKNSGIYRALHSPEITKMAKNIHHKGIHKATFDLAKKGQQQSNASSSANTIRNAASNKTAKSRLSNPSMEAKFGKLKRGLQNTASQSPKKINLHDASRRVASPAASKTGIYRGSGSGPYRGPIYPGWNALGSK